MNSIVWWPVIFMNECWFMGWLFVCLKLVFLSIGGLFCLPAVSAVIRRVERVKQTVNTPRNKINFK